MSKDEFYPDLAEMGRELAERLIEPQLPLRSLSIRVAGNVVTPKEEPKPDCISCGACCNKPLLVPAFRGDIPVLDAYIEVTVRGNTGADVVIDRFIAKDKETANCVNLTGELGREVGCSIYIDRPKVCRDFEAGSDRCHEYRRMYGFERQLEEVEAKYFEWKLQSGESEQKVVDALIYPRSTLNRYGFDEVLTKDIMQICVFLEDETKVELHQYESDIEAWSEQEFVGLTLEQAKERIIAFRPKA